MYWANREKFCSETSRKGENKPIGKGKGTTTKLSSVPSTLANIVLTSICEILPFCLLLHGICGR